MALTGFSREVKEKSDILKVVSSYIDVTRKGSSYLAVCPFHSDTNPSMNINPQRNIFKCFACGEGGDAISFVQKYEKVSLREAVLKVAQICGISVPKDYSNRKSEELSGSQRALDDIQAFYRMMLLSASGKRALEYLHKRGMDDETIQRFGIGYAPSDPTLAIRTLRDRKNHTVQDLEQAGIISSGSSDLRDRYFERIMFPIRDARGHTVGFSGRKYLPDDPSDSKYINSPETPLFVKSKLLYNLDNAWGPARKEGYIYVLEGFMDAIAVTRAGIPSAVALMGTALTDQHIAMLKRLNVQVRLCLDSDEAGQNGEIKIAASFTKAGIPFRVVNRFGPDDGKDADEVLTRKGPEELRRKLSDLLDPVSFRLKTLEPASGDSLRKLDDILAESAGEIAALSESEREMVAQRIAEATGLNIDYARRRLQRAATAKKQSWSTARSTSNSDSKGVSFSSDAERITAPMVAANALQERLSGRDIPEIGQGLLTNETKVLFLLCKSPAACDRMMEWIGQGRTDLLFSLTSALEMAVIEIYERGQMSQRGLTDEQYDSVESLVVQAVQDSPEQYYGLSKEDVSQYWRMARIYSGEFDSKSFQSLLASHESKCLKVEVAARASRDDGAEGLRRLQAAKSRSLRDGQDR